MNADDTALPPALQDCPVIVRLPIQWRDLDAFGYVNNLIYLTWFEEARVVYASRVGVEVVSHDQGVGAIVASLTWKYHRQLQYPGEILAGVCVTRISVGSATLQCHIADAKTGVPLADGSCEVVLFDYGSRKPVPVPDEIRQAVEQLEGKPFPA